MTRLGCTDITTEKIISTLHDITSSIKEPDRLYDKILNIKHILLSIYYDRLCFLSTLVKPIIYNIMKKEHGNANISDLIDTYQKLLDNGTNIVYGLPL